MKRNPVELFMGHPGMPVGQRTLVMGILNVTPDSFSDGGRFDTLESAIAQGMRLIEDGADILDIGGESTRPGAPSVSAAEELGRTLPVLEALRKQTNIPISIDTTKSEVAAAALQAGADIVNDISGLRFDPRVADVTAAAGAGLVLMHSRHHPENMMDEPQYDNVTSEVCEELRATMQIAVDRGVPETHLIIDPGIGFAKTAAHNLILLNELDQLQELECPVLIGPSRKSFIGVVLDLPVAERLEGTAAAVTVAMCRGAQIIRVHDVRPMVRLIRMTDAILQAEGSAIYG
jgi:dihydropteroate synthase